VSLRGKLVLLISGLGAALVVLAFALVHHVFTDYVIRVAQGDVAAARGLLGQAVDKSLEGYALQARVIADETLLKEALVKGAPDLAYTYADAARDRTSAQYLVVLRADGRVLADIRQQYAVGAPFPISVQGAAERGFLSLDGALVSAAVVPVKLGDRVLGSMLLGDRVTPESLGEVEKSSRSGITVLLGEGTAPISTLGAGEAAEVGRVGCSARRDEVRRIDLGGTPHLLALEPLADIRGKELGCIAVTRSLAGPFAEIHRLQRWLLVSGAVITALAIVAGWLASGRVVQQLAGASMQLASAAAQIYASAQQQEAAGAHQAAGVEEVNRTVVSLLESASHIAGSAHGVLANAERTRETTLSMHKQLAALNGHTDRIAELLEVIREIATRSDLLALNASMEAARAGDAGRAFGVVAGEMRRLAERATDTVQSVKSLLADVRTSGGATRLAADESRALAEGTTESARAITSVTEQQRAATEQVLESTRHIGAVLSESVAAAADARASAGLLKGEADRLAEVVGESRLDRRAPG
jgi:hypothetical protein